MLTSNPKLRRMALALILSAYQRTRRDYYSWDRDPKEINRSIQKAKEDFARRKKSFLHLWILS